MGREHCVGSGGQVEPGQGCVVVGPEGPERLAHRASLAVAVGASNGRSRESERCQGLPRAGPLTVLMRRRWVSEPGRQGDVLRVGMSATCEELDGSPG